MKTKMIAPSILSADFLHLADEIDAICEAKADFVHIDVMDGLFVPNLTFGPFIIKQIKSISNIPLDVHLMIENPENWIDKYIQAGAEILSVHLEAAHHLNRTINKIKELKTKACVSINPSTPPQNLEYVLEMLDMVLVMSVNPGFGGQKYIDNTDRKIEWLNNERIKMGYNYLIEVDGGVNENNINRLSKLGVDVFVAGSAIFSKTNYKEIIEKFRRLM